MTQYIVHRLALAIPTLLGLTLLIFFLFRLMIPIDVVDLAAAESDTADLVRQQELREEFGLTGPLVLQYVRWLGRTVSGDSGVSFFTGRSVSSEMIARVPRSVVLGMGALLISLTFSIPIGLLSAARQDHWIDYLLRGSAIMFYAIPGFWIAVLLLVFGSKWFGWAPPLHYKDLWVDPWANFKHIITPMLIMGLSPIGVQIRLVRTQVLEVIRQDYVRTARAKGLSARDVYFRHVLRNALLPLVTVVGLALPGIVGGTVIFEQIFVIPGVGRYLIEALQRLDIYVIMAANLFFGFLLVISNLVVDLSYGFIDPRIRLGR